MDSYSKRENLLGLPWRWLWILYEVASITSKVSTSPAFWAQLKKCFASQFNFNFCVRWKSSSFVYRSRFRTLVTLMDIKIACSYHAEYDWHPKSKCSHRSLLFKGILTTSSGIFHYFSLSLWNMHVWEATKGTHLIGNVLWLVYMSNER